ncbi:hypothetical protein MKW92_025075, partial [Papaver armeniacum]
MKGKIVPILKLETIARENLENCRWFYQFWLESKSPSRASCLLRWTNGLNMAEKKLEQILFLKDTAPPLPSPCRVKVSSTNGDESSYLELIPPFFFAENEDVESLKDVRFQFEEVAKPEMIDFSELNRIIIGEVNDSALEFYFSKFEENFGNHEYFKELLLILYNKSNYVACSSFSLNDTRSLVDRA